MRELYIVSVIVIDFYKWDCHHFHDSIDEAMDKLNQELYRDQLIKLRKHERK